MVNDAAGNPSSAPRIVHVSTYDTRGGAALSTYRLHRGLLEEGLDSKLYVLYKDSADPTVLKAPRAADPMTRARRQFRRWLIARNLRKYEPSRTRDYEIFSDDRAAWGRDVWQGLPPCDVLLLHWTSLFVDCERFFDSINPTIPIAWRLADMNPFTGGCHFDWGCGRFVDNCGRCPQLGSDEEQDLSRSIWLRKKSAYSNRRIDVICANRWMASHARKSSLFGDADISVIPNGVDCSTFCPGDKAAARDSLALPQDVRILMFAAANYMNIRKGMADLVSAIRDLPVDNLFMLLVGSGDVADRINAPCKLFGYTEDPRLLATLYRAADVFVIPSLEDNMPNTCLEAMACGTPVVGYRVGGIPEMVEDGSTGVLVERGNKTALAQALTLLLCDKQKRLAMAKACRHTAVTRFERGLQVKRFVAKLMELNDRLS